MTRGWRKKRNVVGSVVAVAVIAGATLAGGTALRARVATGGGHDGAHASDVRLGATAGSELVNFDVLLAMPGRAELDAFVRQVSDPASPVFHRFLTAAQLGRRFGLDDAALHRVDAELAHLGVTVVESYPQRTALRVRAAAAELDRSFSANLVDFRDARTGARFHRPGTEPVVPRALRGLVSGLAGLDSQPLDLGSGTAAGVDAGRAGRASGDLTPPPGALTPRVVEQAYDLAPLHRAGVIGKDQTVAILSLADLSDADVAAWDQQTGTVGAPALERIVVDPVSATEDETETALDVAGVRGVAPGAHIQLIENGLSKTTWLADSIAAVVKDGKAKVFSASFSGCDFAQALADSGWDRAGTITELQAAFGVGLNMFFSTGDWAAYACRGKWKLNDLDPTVAFPADTPYVTAVGGTHLFTSTDGKYLGEAGWEDPLSFSGTGGGLSPKDPIPSWQRGPGVHKDGISNGHRQIPDVSAAGDPESPLYVVYSNHTDSGPVRVADTVAGTSAAAPLWAGMAALLGQSAADDHVGPLGFVNPMFYDIAASSASRAAFHDVAAGGNLLYDATPGWDFATGLGSPDGARLAVEVLKYLHAHPHRS